MSTFRSHGSLQSSIHFVVVAVDCLEGHLQNQAAKVMYTVFKQVTLASKADGKPELERDD